MDKEEKGYPVPSEEIPPCLLICGLSIRGCGNKELCSVAEKSTKQLEAFAASQRQAGREEAWNHQDVIELNERYSALETAARKAIKDFDLSDLVDALDELGKARRG